MPGGLQLASDPEIDKRLQSNPRALEACLAFPLPGAAQAFFVDTLLRVSSIRVPTLVLWGANDRVVSPDYGRAYAAAIPRAAIDIISPSGHYPHIEQPAAFAQAVFSLVDAIKR